MAKFDARETMKIYLHLGAHKTATTYLQMRLQRNATLLARAGVYVSSLLIMRQRITKPVKRAITTKEVKVCLKTLRFLSEFTS